MNGRRRGVALILVLGTLAVLALLATAFATLTGLDRQVSHNYVDTVRARFAAESGIETISDGEALPPATTEAVVWGIGHPRSSVIVTARSWSKTVLRLSTVTPTACVVLGCT